MPQLPAAQSLQEILDLFDAKLPLERARTIPSAWYTDPEVHDLECRVVFSETWQAMGRLDQVREAGSFFTADWPGEPLLAIRDERGVLRAFHNVCRHRAARVVYEAEGKATKLRCRYHGWTYDLAGQLRGTPEFDGVAEFRREEQGLPPLDLDVCGPFVWVHTPPVRTPLLEFLAPFPERSAGMGIEKLSFVERREYQIACNWKVFVDNYLDGGYHVNTVHPTLAGVLDYSQYRTEIFDHCSVQSSPLRPPELGDDNAAARLRTGDSAYYWWVFPNFMINLYQGMMDTNLVLPMGPDRCRVVFDFYFADVDAAARPFIAESIALAERIQLEDLAICEEVQRGLKSRSYDVGRYSVRREAAVHHFHRLLAERLQSALRN